MNIEEKYMRRALQLAANAQGNTSPNPMVGAVIVDPAGRIIGEGYHRRCGEPHAEVRAVESVADKEALRSATMYVTLEPCSHYGKTPPCAKLILDMGIPRVVVGAADPFPQVSGRGIAMLRQGGVEVVQGILARESTLLNIKFMTAHSLGRPYITLKWACSADGYMDSDRADGHPTVFSTALTSTLVHRERSLHDAILVGSGTALADNPRLDCRLWPGRSPRPVILDRRGRLNSASLRMDNPIILSGYSSLGEALAGLYADGITSLLVEGGAEVLHSFIAQGLWDAARVETSPIQLGHHGRVKAPTMNLPPVNTFCVGKNMIREYRNESNSTFVKNL